MSEFTMTIIDLVFLIVVALIIAVFITNIVNMLCKTTLSIQKNKNETEKSIAEIIAKSNHSYTMETANISAKKNNDSLSITYRHEQKQVSIQKLFSAITSFVANHLRVSKED